MNKNDKYRLDEIDWCILETLQTSGRLSLTELGTRIGLSRPATAERLRRLEEAEVIVGYRAEIDHRRIGYDITAFIHVNAEGDVFDDIGRTVQDLPEVIECHRGTGDDCFILKVIARSLPHLESVIDRLARFGHLTTSVVLSSIVTGRSIKRRSHPEL